MRLRRKPPAGEVATGVEYLKTKESGRGYAGISPPGWDEKG